MIRQAIEKIQELCRPETTVVNGIEYWTIDRKIVQPSVPDPLLVESLSAIVEYIKSAVDGWPRTDTDWFVHIEDPSQVRICDSIHSMRTLRAVRLIASTPIERMIFGQWQDLEDFIIELQSRCTDTSDRSMLLQVLGNVDAQEVRTNADDGVTQMVSVRRGIHLAAGVSIANPVHLAPFRTFTEVAQPISPFILRLRGTEHKQAALFLADGGAWEAEAVANIRDYLDNCLPEGTIILA
jgi:hypothetical protein